MKSPSGPDAKSLSSWLARPVLSRPGLVLLFFLALTGLSLYYIRTIPFRTSYLDLLPAQDPLVAKYEAIQAELSGLDVAAVLLTLVDPPEDPRERAQLLFAGADRVIAHLDPTLFLHASYRVRTEFHLPPELLVFRSMYPEERETLAQLARDLLEFVPLLGGVAAPALPEALPQSPEELDALLGQVEAGTRSLLSFLEKLPQGQALLSQAAALLRQAQGRTPPEDEGQPLLSLDHAHLVVQVWPTQPAYADMAFNRKVRDALLRAVQAAKLEELGIRAGITGLYVTMVEVEDTIRQDMAVVTLISALAVFLLTLLAAGSPLLALTALLPVAISAVLTVAWAKFAVHGFNLLTTFIPALLLGLGIDFSLHLLSQFSEARADGLGLVQAVTLAVRKKAASSFVAALTTAVVFSSLLLSRSRALWELGAIMAPGILVAYLTVFSCVPALLLLLGRVRPNLRGRPVFARERLVHPYRNFLRLRKGVLLFSVVLTAIALGKAVRIQFKFASGELVPPTPGQAVTRELMEHFAGQLWFGETFRVFVSRPEELAVVGAQLKEHPLVHEVASARDLLPTALLGEAVRFRDLPLSTVDEGLGRLRAALARWPEFRQGLEDTAALFSLLELQALLRGEVRRALVLSRHAENFFLLAEELGEVDLARVAQVLEALEADLGELAAFAQKLRALPDENALIDQILTYLPAEIRNRYRISRGYVLEVRVTPAIYEDQNLARFVAWLREQGLDYVGSAEIQVALEHHMRRDFFLTSGLALVLIFLIVLADLRRVSEAALALLPLLMGYAWMLGGMALLGIRFNFTNIVISPLLIGLGVDGAVHLLHRAREEPGREGLVRAAAAIAGAILGSYLTTMASFGALLSAQTPGLRFLGASALLGLGFTTLWTVGFLPAALGELRERARTNKVP